MTDEKKPAPASDPTPIGCAIILLALGVFIIMIMWAAQGFPGLAK